MIISINNKILNGDWELEDTYDSEDEAEKVANDITDFEVIVDDNKI